MKNYLYISVLVQGVWFDLRIDNRFDEPEHIVRRRFLDWASGHGDQLQLLNLDGGSEVWIKASQVGAVKS